MPESTSTTGGLLERFAGFEARPYANGGTSTRMRIDRQIALNEAYPLTKAVIKQRGHCLNEPNKLLQMARRVPVQSGKIMCGGALNAVSQQRRQV
jgi:hypothetical protein